MMVTKKNGIKRPPFIKILLSGMIDLNIFFLLTYLVNLVVFSTPISNHYYAVHVEMLERQDAHKLSTGYGEKLYLNQEYEDKHEDLPRYEDEFGTYVVVNLESVSEDIQNAYQQALNGDEHYSTLLNDYQITSILLLTLIMGVSQLTLFFLIPMLTKHRATIGRLILGLSVIDYRTKKPLAWYLVLLQVILILLFASLIPYIIIGEMAVIFSPLFILAFVIFSRDFRSFHQWLAHAMTIENKNKIIEGVLNHEVE